MVGEDPFERLSRRLTQPEAVATEDPFERLSRRFQGGLISQRLSGGALDRLRKPQAPQEARPTGLVDGQEESLDFSRGLDPYGSSVDPHRRALAASEAIALNAAEDARKAEHALRIPKTALGAVASLIGVAEAFGLPTNIQPSVEKLQSRMAPPATDLLGQTLEAFGQTLPIMATAPLSMPLAGAMGVSQQVLGAYQNTLQATGDEKQARRAGLLNAPVGLLDLALPSLSKLPIGKGALAKLLPFLARLDERSGGRLSGAVLGAGTEMTTEALQTILENGIANLVTDEDRPMVQGVKEILAPTGLVGAIFTGFTGRPFDTSGLDVETKAAKPDLEANLARSRQITEAEKGGAPLGVPIREGQAPPGTPPSPVRPEQHTMQPQEVATPEVPGGPSIGTPDAELLARSQAIQDELLSKSKAITQDVLAPGPSGVLQEAEKAPPRGEEEKLSVEEMADLRQYVAEQEAAKKRVQELQAKADQQLEEQLGRFEAANKGSGTNLEQGQAQGREVEQEEKPASQIPGTIEDIPEALPPKRSEIEQMGAFPPPLFGKKSKGEAVPEEVNQGFDLPDETLLRRAQRIAQDSLNRVRVIQGAVEEQGGEVSEESDIAGKADLFSGKMEEHQRRLDKEILEPLKATAGRGDIKLADIDEFLVARSADKRNAIISERSEGKNTAGSGMTDAQAAEVLAKHENNPRMKRIGEIVDAMNRETRNILVDGGIISQETADAWVKKFGDHYVPLKTFVEGAREGSGRGFSIPRGPFSKKAKGRRSMADSPLTYSVLQYQSAAIQAERNRVGQAVKSFIEANPDENQWRSYKPGARPKDLPHLSPDRTLTVKVNGEPEVIEFADPLLARALLNLGKTKGGKLLQVMGGLGRAYSRLQTSWNPEFVVTNLARDIQTAGLNLTADETAGFAKKVTSPKSVYKSGLAIYRVLRDPKASGEYEQAFKEMRKAGGKVGWFNHKDFAQQFKEIENDLKSLEGEGAAMKVWRAMKRLGDAVDTLNSAVENGVRLSAYVESRKRGMSEQEAAKLSRNLTVDFNKRGEWGNAINAAYVFYGAGINGTVRLLQSVTTKRGMKLAGSIVAFGALNAMLNYMLGGEDDDGVPFYDKIGEDKKGRAMVFLIPGWMDEDGKPKHVQIPMPYGYRFLHSIGRNAVEAMLGRKSAKQMSSDLAMHAAQNFSPIGGESSFNQLIAPTALDPFVQISENKTFDGRPIYPNESFEAYPKPDSYRYHQSVSPISKAIAQGVNKITGGDEYTSGGVDVSPETIDHLFDFVIGGAGRTGRRLINTANKVIQGEKLEAHEIPFWRSVVGEHYNAFDRDRFYGHLDEMAIFEEKVRRARGGSLSNKDTVESRALINENRKAWSMRDEYYRKIGGKDSLQDRLKQAKDAKDEKTESEIYLDFNKRWREATGRNP